MLIVKTLLPFYRKRSLKEKKYRNPKSIIEEKVSIIKFSINNCIRRSLVKRKSISREREI